MPAAQHRDRPTSERNHWPRSAPAIAAPGGTNATRETITSVSAQCRSSSPAWRVEFCILCENASFYARKISCSAATAKALLVASGLWVPRLQPHSPSEADMTTGSESDVGNAIVRKDLGLWLQQWPGFNTTTTNAAAPGPVKVPSTSAGSATSSWSNTPAHSASDMVVTVSFKNWLRRPDLVYASPDHPQPLELLYGSKTKFVADTLHHSPRSWPCRDPWASGYGVAHVLSDQMDAAADP